MKRFHVHVNVADLEASIRFYENLFGVAPTVAKPDYAKWMLDDPRVNFAISARDRTTGVDHLGLQVDDREDLEILGRRLAAADALALAETDTNCCYARSDKYWAEDPQGLRWETFRTLGAATGDHEPAGGAGCCGPRVRMASEEPAHARDAACCVPAASRSVSCGG